MIKLPGRKPKNKLSVTVCIPLRTPAPAFSFHKVSFYPNESQRRTVILPPTSVRAQPPEVALATTVAHSSLTPVQRSSNSVGQVKKGRDDEEPISVLIEEGWNVTGSKCEGSDRLTTRYGGERR